MRLQDALRDDMLVTKRDKPFVVVIDYEKYVKLREYLVSIGKCCMDDSEFPSIVLGK